MAKLPPFNRSATYEVAREFTLGDRTWRVGEVFDAPVHERRRRMLYHGRNLVPATEKPAPRPRRKRRKDTEAPAT